MSYNFTEDLSIAMERLHKNGAFLTTKDGEKANTMTISWGDIGFQWKRPVFIVMVRKSRYTHGLMEKEREFTVTVPLNDDFKNQLAFCGSKSGRDFDKFNECALKAVKAKEVGAPIIGGENMVHYECKVLYSHELDKSKLSEEVINSSYKDDDMHTMYYAEIVNCYRV